MHFAGEVDLTGLRLRGAQCTLRCQLIKRYLLEGANLRRGEPMGTPKLAM